jgi:hypothetical protein
MTKTTITGKGRLGLLLCLTGLLSFAGARTILAQGSNDQDNGQQAPQAYEQSNGDPNANLRADYDNRPGDGGPVTADAGDVDDQASPEAQDPPSRVARLSFLEGSVSMQPGGSGDWGAAAQNRPVTIGDKLWVDKDARAELQAGEASIHIGAMTALSFLNLDQNITQIRLAEGSINFRVRELREGDTYEVDTPNAAFTVRQAGAFRIDVNENGDGTLVSVIRGEGEVVAGGKNYNIRPGDLAEFNGTDTVEYHTERAPEPDDLDQWAAQRDRREENSVSAKYVGRDMVGYSDLDNNGSWNDEEGYGHVWYPNEVGPGWAPYSNGYWSTVGPWGYTWIGYEPWGFAPYHYGRWHYFGSRWGWCPGPIGFYPVYGPAFVGFLGGGGFGFGVGFGVGWFPLGFGEIYHPWYHYHAGGAYIRNINIHNTYIRNVNNITSRNYHANYAYAHNTRAVTTTTHNGFVNGQAVNRGASHVTEASLRGAGVNNHISATPGRTSYVGAANARANVARPSVATQNRAVVARSAPAAGASHLPVRTLGPSTGGRTTYVGNQSARNGGGNSAVNNSRSQQLSNNRPPSAQNNGRTNGPYNNNAQNSQGASRNNNYNRPPSANSNGSYNQGSQNYNGNGGSRSYNAPQQQRGYSSPSQGSAPGRSSSAPSRGYSAPSRSSYPHGGSSGGGGSRGGGGGSPHGGGGSSHGGGNHH